jgi:ferritin-like metal-binding protein YciE
MEDPRDRLLRYLDDAHAAEVGSAEALQGFVNETKNDTAKKEFETHLMLAKDHANRVEKRLRELGGQPSGSKRFFSGLMGKLSDIMHAAHDDYDKTTQDLIKTYAIDHMAVGMYASLAAYSHAYGDQDTAALAEAIMGEEKEAADRARPMIATCAADTFTATMQKKAA